VIWRWLAVLIAVAGIALGAGAWYALQLLEPASHDADSESTIFEVTRGKGLNQIAVELESQGLIRSALALKVLARTRSNDAKPMAGEYELNPTWSARTILARITSGRVVTYEVVLPEGIRANEIAKRLAAAGLADADAFLAATEDAEFTRSLGIDADRLEGYLYPETYRLPRGLTPKEIARVLVQQFEQVWAEVPSANSPLSKHEIVTLASIVEKETAAPEERPLIASVFLNRLDRGMRLETDPTVIYGIEDFDGNIKKKHLRDRSNPYNTYRIKGLPPGPIASPGFDALMAVVKPAESQYLYFVSRNDGTHQFSETYREHVNAVNHFQLRRRNR